MSQERVENEQRESDSKGKTIFNERSDSMILIEETIGNALLNIGCCCRKHIDLNALDLQQLSLLHKISGELIVKLKKRSEELDRDQRYKQPLSISLPQPGSPAGGYDERHKQPVGGDDQCHKNPVPFSLPAPGTLGGGYGRVQTPDFESWSEQCGVDDLLELPHQSPPNI